eukprot:757729-Hanusia_phi.AAC.4
MGSDGVSRGPRVRYFQRLTPQQAKREPVANNRVTLPSRQGMYVGVLDHPSLATHTPSTYMSAWVFTPRDALSSTYPTLLLPKFLTPPSFLERFETTSEPVIKTNREAP